MAYLEKYGLIGENSMVRYQNSMDCRKIYEEYNIKDIIKILPQKVTSSLHGIPFKKGSPLYEKFDKFIVRFVEGYKKHYLI